MVGGTGRVGGRRGEGWNREVGGGHRRPVEAAALDRQERGVQLLDLRIRDGPNPVAGARKVFAAPGGGTEDRRRGRHAHGHRSFTFNLAAPSTGLRSMAVTKGSILTTTWHVNDRTGRRLLNACAS